MFRLWTVNREDFLKYYYYYYYYTTYLLTYSMVQSPSWEAYWFATSQEIPCILWNPKVHYHTHNLRTTTTTITTTTTTTTNNNNNNLLLC